MAGVSKKYTTIAANEPVARTKAGVDDWKVVGGVSTMNNRKANNKPKRLKNGKK